MNRRELSLDESTSVLRIIHERNDVKRVNETELETRSRT